MQSSLLGLKACNALQVRELELNENLASVENLLTFLESIFNGGSDFKYAPLLHRFSVTPAPVILIPVTLAHWLAPAAQDAGQLHSAPRGSEIQGSDFKYAPLMHKPSVTLAPVTLAFWLAPAAQDAGQLHSAPHGSKLQPLAAVACLNASTLAITSSVRTSQWISRLR